MQYSPLLQASCGALPAYPTWSWASHLWPNVSHKLSVTAGKWSLKAKLSLYIATVFLPETTVYFLCLCCCRWAVLCPLPKPAAVSASRGTGTRHWAGSRHGLRGRPHSACLAFWVEKWKKHGTRKVSVLGSSQPLEERKKNHSVTHGISFLLHCLRLWQNSGCFSRKSPSHITVIWDSE